MTTPSLPALREMGFAGCFEVGFQTHSDPRGRFLKAYHQDTFRAQGLCTDWPEEFITTSAKNVIRGMHFQIPPAEHVKLVICLSGRVLDVVLDLRGGSPTYGRSASVELSGNRANGVYIPAGFAHGFQSLEDESTLLYKVSSMHSPEYDQGLRWDSIGFDWPVTSPILSERDASFGALSDFQTPFRT